jgi:hypothetical protein
MRKKRARMIGMMIAARCAEDFAEAEMLSAPVEALGVDGSNVIVDIPVSDAPVGKVPVTRSAGMVGPKVELLFLMLEEAAALAELLPFEDALPGGDGAGGDEAATGSDFGVVTGGGGGGGGGVVDVVV